MRRLTTQATRKKVTAMQLMSKKRHGQKISMVTAYDYPSALHLDRAGIDIALVGDSVGMVVLGYDTTQPVTMGDMLHHCKAVYRGNKSSLLVGDLPLGSYEMSPKLALQNAYRFVKEAGMDAVKLEGGKNRAETVKKIVEGGVAVMGHIGLTPQAISVLGGFRAQGRTAVKARALVDDALALQDAGAFAVVIECVPASVAAAISAAVEIPTIGIGAGPHTSGQVLVYHDLLGITHHPHHAQHVPSFCRRYATVGETISDALEAYKESVESSNFPDDEFSPYTMSEEEALKFEKLLKTDEEMRATELQVAAKRLIDADEYETIKLY